MGKKAFTLIELLAVIVVLAIIAIITIPMILGIVEKARRKAAIDSLYGYIDAVEKQIMLDTLKGNTYENGRYYISDIEYQEISYLSILESIKADTITPSKYL